jgi:hypothetical protein
MLKMILSLSLSLSLSLISACVCGYGNHQNHHHQHHLGSFNNGPKQGDSWCHGYAPPLIIASKFKPATVKIGNVSTTKFIIISTENELFRELHIVDMSEEHFLLVNTHTHTQIYIYFSLSLSLSLSLCVCVDMEIITSIPTTCITWDHHQG